MVNVKFPRKEQAPSLHPEDAILLEQCGAIGSVTNNKRLFSQRAIASISSSSVASPNVDTDPHAELLPDQRQSREHLEYLGYESDTARTLWRRWSDWQDDPDDIGLEPPDLEEVVVCAMDSKEDNALSLSDDWHAVMTSWGINEELQAKIMNPEFEAVRLTEGAKHWVMLAMKGREKRLDDIYARSRNRFGRWLKRRVEKPFSAEAYTPEDVNETEDREDIVKLGTDEDGNIVRQHDDDGNIVRQHDDDAKHSNEQQMPLLKTGWTALWKPLVNYLCKESHYLYCFPACTHSDFRGIGGGYPPLYLFASKDLATTYARYMASLIGGGSSGARLLRIDVPAYLVESLHPFHLEFDAEYEDSPDTALFKQVVHASRSGRRWPANLAAHEKWPLLIGNVCKSDERAVAQLARWQDVSKEHLVEHEGAEWDDDKEGFEGGREFAIQYAFSGEETIDRLVAEGEVFLETFGDD
ncbi:MAG: hypothetical protein OHK93_005414 [Ramalina farinacea]|uniref:Uncharacterized protein n=1 Tax=Ramalina farinacea TaxID=258253 RepID=A0AA43QK51_9LECA|nr:hypothetical protein [Ramalina farinacea]